MAKKERRLGKVKFYNTKKEFGFITDVETKNDLYVHDDDLIDFIVQGDDVTFEVAKTEKGLVAVKVEQHFED